MHYNKILIPLIALQLVWSPTLFAQQIKGTVFEKNNSKEVPLAGVYVYWSNTQTGIATDGDGKFEIPSPLLFPARLVFSFIGYEKDTLLISDLNPVKVILKNAVNLKEINIEKRRETTSISTINPINTQVISTGELRKAACCNLAESFETNPSVDVSYTDAVSGARQIQMLGLDGIYTQILAENTPLVRGLSSAYGLGFVPGPFVQSIYVSKGVGSVINGYESITGQLNIEMNAPEKADLLFVNGYINSDLRSELNVQIAKKANKHASGILFIHGSDGGLKKDMNHDGFMDGPVAQQLNLLNRWNFQGKNIEGQLGLRAVLENRNGGQIDDKNETHSHDVPYLIDIKNRQFELFTKTGFLSTGKPDKSLGLITSTKFNKQNMLFGLKSYDGEQISFYGNLIYQNIISSDKHMIKTGLSFVYDDYRESYNDSLMRDYESVPGAFAEYNFKNNNKIALILGLRADYQNTFGWFFTPRFHFKYNFLPETVLRLSAGSGYRTARVFTENPSVFANSRVLVIQEGLLPEKAWNFGISMSHKFYIGEMEGTIILDYFHTRFTNQVVVDLEKVNEVQFYNLDGKSYSNSYQAQLDFTPFKRVDVRVAYKRYDVKATYGGILLDKPFVARDRALLNLAYATHMDRWKFDVTLKWIGISRIPNTKQNPDNFQLASQSEKYITLNAQVTKAFRKFEVYLGAENITDFTQKNPIIAPDDPYGPNFDASLVWGPIMGRLFYAGFRFNIR